MVRLLALIGLLAGSAGLAGAEEAAADPAPGPHGDRRRLSLIVSAALDGQLATPDCRAGAPRGRTVAHLAASVAEAVAAADHDGRTVVSVLHLGDVAGAGALSRFLLTRPDGAEKLTTVLRKAGFTHAIQGRNWYALGPKVIAALSRGLTASGVQFLSANVGCEGREDCEPLAATPARAVFSDDGLIISLLGATGESVVSAVDAAALKGLSFTPVAASLAVEAKAVRDGGSHIVIAAVHENGLARGFSEFEAVTSALPSVDLFVVNELGAYRSSTAAFESSRGQNLVVAGRTPTDVVQIDFDAVRHGESWRVEGVHASRRTATAPEPGLDTDVQALHAAFCADRAKPLPVVADPPIALPEFLHAMLEAVRLTTSSELAIVNEGLASSAVFPLSGALSAADLFAAIRYDDEIQLATIDGAALRGLWRANATRIAAGQPALAFAGLAQEGDKLLANGRPLEDESPYRVAIPDFLARGGDGWVTWTMETEPAEKPGGGAWTFRDAMESRAREASPGTQLSDLAGPELLSRFRWTWSNMISGYLTDTSGLHHQRGGLNRRLDRDPSTVLGAEFSGRLDGDQQDHAVRLSGRARYYSAVVAYQGSNLVYELEDTAFVEALYRLRILSRQMGDVWYAPVPYASVAVDTEFTPHAETDVYPVRFLDLASTVGVRFTPARPFELKLGAGLRRLVLDPTSPNRRGVVFGFDLPRETAAWVAGTPIDVEGSLDYFLSPATVGVRQEGRMRVRLLVPLVGWLGVSAGVDVYAYSDGTNPFALLTESSLSLTVRQAGARQWQ